MVCRTPKRVVGVRHERSKRRGVIRRGGEVARGRHAGSDADSTQI